MTYPLVAPMSFHKAYKQKKVVGNVNISNIIKILFIDNYRCYSKTIAVLLTIQFINIFYFYKKKYFDFR